MPSSPASNAIVTTDKVSLEWIDQDCDSLFDVEISRSIFFNPIFDSKLNIASHSVSIGDLSPSSTYYWRIRAADPDLGDQPWSTIDSFTTSFDNAVTGDNINMDVAIFPNPVNDHSILTIAYTDQNDRISSVTITSALGVTIQEIEGALTSPLTIELPVETKGLYVITVITENRKRLQKKIIVR